MQEFKPHKVLLSYLIEKSEKCQQLLRFTSYKAALELVVYLQAYFFLVDLHLLIDKVQQPCIASGCRIYLYIFFFTVDVLFEVAYDCKCLCMFLCVEEGV